MKLYADYIKEHRGDELIQFDEGFATYRFVEGGKTVYIVDIYVLPDARKYGHASKLADTIAAIGKKHGCTSMLGSVQPSANGSTDSLRVLLAYGMRLDSAIPDGIYMRKEI